MLDEQACPARGGAEGHALLSPADPDRPAESTAATLDAAQREAVDALTRAVVDEYAADLALVKAKQRVEAAALHLAFVAPHLRKLTLHLSGNVESIAINIHTGEREVS